MKKAVLKFTALCLAVGITFSGTGSVAMAAGSGSLLAGFGASSIKVIPEAQQTEAAETEATASQEIQPVQETYTEDYSEDYAESYTEDYTEETSAPVETEPVVDTSMSGELAFAQCDEYINIRSSASTEGEVVGKVYNNGSVTILSQVGDWYEVQSGNAVGYVKADYFAIGEQADAIAEEVAYNVATVYPEALVIRSQPSEDAESIGMAYSSDELEVVAYEGDWMKVALGGGVYGYVSAYYVAYDTYYATAETLEEEQARLDAEWLAYLAEEEAKRQAEEQAWLEYLAQQEAEQAAAEQAWLEAVNQQQAQESVSTGSASASDAQAAADAAYEEYLAAQAEADAATQQADEQLVYDTAEEAQQKYEEFLALQNAADQAAVDSTYTENTYTEDTYVEDTYTEDTYVEDTYVEDTYVEDTTYDDVYYVEEDTTYDEEVYYDDSADEEVYEEEVYYEDTSSSYTLGQQIVDYATQFVGNPYVWGGTSLTNGADCSGFVQSVFANFGISLPRTAASQAGCGTAVDLGSIQAGDLLFYYGDSGINHVTLYMGNGQVVHASNSNTGIIISDYGYRTPSCARRYW